MSQPTKGSPEDNITKTQDTQPAEALMVNKLHEGMPFGRYTLGPLLGKGGASHVYEAYDPTLERKVAIKILHGQERDWTRQALTEARAQASVDHEYICKVYDVGRHEHLSYIAMQRINGKPLGEVAAELTLREKVELMQRILHAVDAAHRHGLIHRDLKPSNILVEQAPNRFWKPYVTDFGLARELTANQGHSHSKKVQGTPTYMAPEQARGESIRDTLSDIYSLGATFYRLLSGVRPFSGNNPIAVMLKVVREPPKPLRAVDPKIPAELEAIVAKAMAKNPEDRFESVPKFIRDLNRFLQGEAVVSYSQKLTYRIWKQLSRHAAVSSISGFFLLLFLVMGGMVTSQRFKSSQQALLQERFLDEIQAIQWQMRINHMLPAHDIRADREQVRRRMEGIEAEMTRLGDVAMAPGNYALGRGYLELNDPVQALHFLELAQAQSSKPQLDVAWGEATCRIYHKQLREARRLRDDIIREQELKRLKETYLVPGLKAMRLGEQHPIKPGDFIRAQIAYFEDRFDEALALAEKVSQENTWFYEAQLLKVEVFTEKGRQLTLMGDFDLAKPAYEQAMIPMAKAHTIAGSDIDVFLVDCEWRASRMDLACREAKDVELFSQRLLEMTDRALEVEPDNSIIHGYRAYAFYRLAEHTLYYSHQDPGPLLTLSAQAAEQALAVEPGNAWALQYMGHAYSMWGEYMIELGQDAETRLELANSAYKRALEVEPQNVGLLNSLGIVSWQMAELAGQKNRPSDDYLKTSIHYFQQIALEAPQFYIGYNNLGLAYWTGAEISLNRGQDPSDLFALAEGQFRKSIEVGAYDYAYLNLAELNLLRAVEAGARGVDPEALLVETEKACRYLIQKNPADPQPYWDLCAMERIRGDIQCQKGLDPSEYYNRVPALLKDLSPEILGQPEMGLERARLAASWTHWYQKQGDQVQAKYWLKEGKQELAKFKGEMAKKDKALIEMVFNRLGKSKPEPGNTGAKPATSLSPVSTLVYHHILSAAK